MNGPFGPYGHGAILPVMEVITRHIEKIVTKMQTEDIKSFMPSQRATDDFKRHRELYLKRTAWSSPCRSWFKLGKIDGPIMMWPGSRLHMFHVMENPRWEVRQSLCLVESIKDRLELSADLSRITNGNG